MLRTQTYMVSSLRRLARQDRDGVRLWRFGSGVQVLGSLGSQFWGLCCQRHVALPEAVVRGELRTDIDVREQDCDLQLRAENSES